MRSSPSTSALLWSVALRSELSIETSPVHIATKSSAISSGNSTVSCDNSSVFCTGKTAGETSGVIILCVSDNVRQVVDDWRLMVDSWWG